MGLWSGPAAACCTCAPATSRGACRYASRDSQPLELDPQFVGLHRAQVARTFHQMFLHPLTRLLSARLPGQEGPFVDPQRHHNRLERAPVRQQGDDQRQRFFRRPQPVKGCARPRRTGLPTHAATVALFFLAEDADIAFANLPACRTLLVRAKYFERVHGALSLPRRKGLCPWTRTHSSRLQTPSTVTWSATDQSGAFVFGNQGIPWPLVMKWVSEKVPDRSRPLFCVHWLIAP
jgi:hypothetical protein